MKRSARSVDRFGRLAVGQYVRYDRVVMPPTTLHSFWNNQDEPVCIEQYATITRCMAIDRYSRVAQNIAALAATIEAMRAIERHGGAAILDRAFTGFTALPPPIVAGMKRPWREVLGIPAGLPWDAADVSSAYRRLAAENHPDRGGDAGKMAEINAARDEALRELGNG